MQDLPPVISPNQGESRLSRVLFGTLFSLLAVFLFGATFLYLVESKAPPENVRITNVTEASLTVSWTTAKPTNATVFYTQEDWRLAVPFFWRLLAKGVADDVGGPSTTHHVTIPALGEQSSYRFLISTGIKGYLGDARGNVLPTLETGRQIDKTLTPFPAYGKVTRIDGVFPAEQALVYLTAQNSSGLSLSLSTITNLDGNWAQDLSNLKSEAGEIFQITDDTEFTVETLHPEHGLGMVRFNVGDHAPAPTISMIQE